jgi:hypothetical protein
MRVSALRAGESPAKRVSAKQDGGAGVRQVPYFSDSFQTVSKSLRAIPQINPQTEFVQTAPHIERVPCPVSASTRTLDGYVILQPLRRDSGFVRHLFSGGGRRRTEAALGKRTGDPRKGERQIRVNCPRSPH